MDFKQALPVSLIKPMQSRSQKTIQPKQPPRFSPTKHQFKRTPEFPGQSEHLNFTTPEKSSAPSPLTSKTQFSLNDPTKTTLSSLHRTLFPAKSSVRLIQHTSSNPKLNPKFLIPVLSARKHTSKLSKGSIDFTPEKTEQNLVFVNNDSFAIQEIPERPKSPQKIRDFERVLKTAQKNLVQNESESEEVLFLSDRVSYECDSEQSLKIDMQKFEIFSGNESQNRGNAGLADQCTQTEELEAALNNLDKSEIRSGMEFLNKIYSLLQPLSNS